jgi:hypothetical protein
MKIRGNFKKSMKIFNMKSFVMQYLFLKFDTWNVELAIGEWKVARVS